MSGACCAANAVVSIQTADKSAVRIMALVLLGKNRFKSGEYVVALGQFPPFIYSPEQLSSCKW